MKHSQIQFMEGNLRSGINFPIEVYHTFQHSDSQLRVVKCHNCNKQLRLITISRIAFFPTVEVSDNEVMKILKIYS